MRPSDARMEGMMHLRRRLMAGQANDLCFPTAVNRRGATRLETDVRKLQRLKSYNVKRDEAKLRDQMSYKR
jgi:hypothetical protein